MQGPEYAAAKAARWLTTAIPPQLRALEVELGVDPGGIVDPVRVLDHERGPIGIEDWPTVYVLPLRLDRLTLLDVDEEAAETYRASYTVRVLSWVRADDYATTDLLARRYGIAVRRALLTRKTLEAAAGVWTGNPDADLTVDPASIREDYSGVLLDDASRTIAGVDTTVTVTVTEVLPGPASPGVVDTVAVDPAPLPTHPALD